VSSSVGGVVQHDRSVAGVRVVEFGTKTTRTESEVRSEDGERSVLVDARHTLVGIVTQREMKPVAVRHCRRVRDARLKVSRIEERIDWRRSVLYVDVVSGEYTEQTAAASVVVTVGGAEERSRVVVLAVDAATRHALDIVVIVVRVMSTAVTECHHTSIIIST